MKSLKSFIFGKKSVPFIDSLTEETREGLNKGYIPKFLYKPPFGYPRYANIDYVRYLAKTPYVDMCIDTILKELTSIEWDIIPNPDIPEEEFKDSKVLKKEVNSEIAHIKSFFNNPNSNPNEGFDDIFIKAPIRDMLEINTGVLNKVFNMKQEMVEIVARDGATYTKNPDIHGMMTDRAEVLIPKQIVNNMSEAVNPFQHISAPLVREKGAYFQYGWIAGPLPVPFGKREIVWLQDQVRSDDIYGISKVQILAKSLQTLLYYIESDLEYFNDNNVPKGIIGLDASDADDIKGFKEQWNEMQKKKDEFGNWKKVIHKVPILNYIPKFERIQFTSGELQLIEKQRWWAKMVWAMFGVTPTELGYTEDAAGQANQIVQSKVFRKKAINPIIKLLENRYNKEIITEFGYFYEVPNTKGLKLNKYKFTFNTFDIDEEKNKYELYKLQVLNGLKTVNEIRQLEGCEPVDWGDDPPKNWQSSESSFNFGNLGNFQQQQDNTNKPDDKENKVPDSKEPNENYDKTKTENENKSIESNIKEKSEKKNPLVLGENEQPDDPNRLKQAILYLLNQQEKNILDLIEKELNQETINNIKSQIKGYNIDEIEVKGLNEIIQKLKDLINLKPLKLLTSKIIRNNFLNGMEDAEKKLDRNFMPDTDAIEYITNYTFENIKNVSKDIQEKLRGELQRAFMDGEGIDQIKKRVKKVFDVNDNRAEMIARTETQRARNFGQLSSYKKAGVKGKKEFVAKIDNRTSPICKRLDSQVVDINENFKDPNGEWEGAVPPSHINCRSTWVFIPDVE